MQNKNTNQTMSYYQQQKDCKSELEAYWNFANEYDEQCGKQDYQLSATEDEKKGEMSIRIIVPTEYGPIIKTITRTPQLKEMKSGVVKLTYEGFVPEEYHLNYLASMGMNHTHYIKVTASYGEIHESKNKVAASPEYLARIRIVEGKYRGGIWRFESHDSIDPCYDDYVDKHGFVYENLFNSGIVKDYAAGLGLLCATPKLEGYERFEKECAGPFWNMQHYFNREAQKAHVPYTLIEDNTVIKPDLQNYVQEHEMKN